MLTFSLHFLYTHLQDNHEGDIVITHIADLFLEKLFVAFTDSLIEPPSITCWISFIKAIAAHDDIPDDNVFKGEAIHLLSLCLSPLAGFLQSISADETIDSDYKLNLLELLVDIMKIIPKAFEYQKLSPIVGSKFVKAMEDNNDIFVSESSNNLDSYLKLLLQEVS